MNRIILFSMMMLALAAGAILVRPVLAERVYLDITASDVRKVVVAIPSFAGDEPGQPGAAGTAMAALLGKGLVFHGFIKVIDPGRYGNIQDADWNGMGVDYVVRGQYRLGKGELVIEGRLFDVADNTMLSGRRYRGTPGQQDDMVLKLCDAIVEEFRGEPGISRTSIAYVSDGSGFKEVYIGDVLGRKQRQITHHRHLCVSPRFTPDGNYLAYTTYHHGNQDLYITDLRQNKVTQALSRYRGMNLAPAFVPDGKTMVVTLSKDGGPNLYLMNRRGKVIKQLTRRTGINVSPSFSPDGRSLVFVSDRSGRPQVYVMDMSSHRTQRLTFQGSENSEPSWSPKGDLIAYTSLVDGHYQIFTIDAAGHGVPKQVTSGWGDFESPTWSPDGEQIAFSRRRNGHSVICAIFKNGSEMRVLFSPAGNQSYPRWSTRP